MIRERSEQISQTIVGCCPLPSLPKCCPAQFECGTSVLKVSLPAAWGLVARAWLEVVLNQGLLCLQVMPDPLCAGIHSPGYLI